MERPQTLINFLEAAKQAALATVPTGSDAETAANRIFNALEKPAELVEAEPSTELGPAHCDGAANRIFNALEKPAELVEAEPSTATRVCAPSNRP